jgi:hypothetical protein
MGNQTSTAAYCHQHEWWDEFVASTLTAEAYDQVVRFMFEDGIVNRGRLLVLEVFTRDLCDRRPAIATEVWDRYKNMYDELASQLPSVP